jgi:peroxiredoxin
MHPAAHTGARFPLALGALALAFATGTAAADIQIGATPPNFSKPLLVGSTAGPSVSLSDYAGKIVVLYFFGYNCPVCLNQAPSFETEVNQHYAGSEVVEVLGIDLWDGTPAQVANFRNVSQATYPLLLYGGLEAGGDLDVLYGPWDNFLVLDLRDQTVRYHAALYWLHGARYKPSEIRQVVDQLLIVDAGPAPGALALAALPNPAHGRTTVSFSVPEAAVGAVRLTVHDASGRHVATLYEGPASGARRIEWSAPRNMGAGVYWIRLAAAGRTLQRRIVFLP